MSQIESKTSSSAGSLQKTSRRKIFGGTKTKLKSFKGFITGKSRRERRVSSSKALYLSIAEESKNLPELTLDTAPSTDSRANDDREDETVYGMELDNASTVSALSENVKATTDYPARGSTMDIVLLLMDNETRRFELLQVDVDSPAALVKDILVKIPDHATEPSLKHQSFSIVCDRHGNTLDTDKPLSNFFTDCADMTSEGCRTFLLLAVTSTKQELNGSDCAKLAKPILTHPKISNMLQTLGVVQEHTNPDSKITSPAKDCVVPLEVPEVSDVTPSTPNTMDSISSSVKVEANIRDQVTKSSPSSFMSFFLKVVLIGSLVTVIYSSFLQVHMLYRSAPLTQFGHVLAPGSWRSQCGLFHLLPSKISAGISTPYASVNAVISSIAYFITSAAYCSPNGSLSVHMSTNGTTLEVYRDTQLIYALVGETCAPSATPSVLQSFMNVSDPNGFMDDSCIPGARVSANGSILIGGQPPISVATYGLNQSSIMVELHSWPFSENVHLPYAHSAHKVPTRKVSKDIIADGKRKSIKFPWENIKIVWPWEKNKK